MPEERSVTAYDLFGDLQDRLQLEWICGPTGEDAPSLSPLDLTERPAATGFLNLVHPNRVQVVGCEESAYLDDLDDAALAVTVEQMFVRRPLAILFGDGLDVPGPVRDRAADSPTALIRSRLRSHELVSYLDYHIARSLARRVTLHGVFMEMFTIGVLITGDPASGKSELALELLTRGHRLIADDAPEFSQISPEIIEGTCPEVLQDCLEVRGLGVLNVRHMFGDSAVKQNKFLRLIIHLDMPPVGSGPLDEDRLRGNSTTLKVLGVEVQRITIPVLAGRNLAVMAEAAVRDFMLKMRGFDAAAEFLERHARMLQDQAERPGD
jgi:HPr kinase/phosphorylase